MFPWPFRQAASVFSVQTRLKAQIFEVIPSTAVNTTTNADGAKRSLCGAASSSSSLPRDGPFNQPPRSQSREKPLPRSSRVLSIYATRNLRKRNAAD